MKKTNKIIYLFFLLFPVFCFAQETVEPIKFKANKVIYYFKKGKEKTICKGNAKIWRSDFFLQANKIEIYGKENNISKAYNNVKIISYKDSTIITGGYAEYNNETSYAKVFKNPILTVTNEKLTIHSGIMENFIKENRAVAIGNVVIEQTNYTAYCEKGVYYRDKQLIELTGNPVVYYEDNIFKSEKIIVYIKKKNIKLYGRVYAKLISD